MLLHQDRTDLGIETCQRWDRDLALCEDYSRFCRDLVQRMPTTFASLAVSIWRLLCAMGMNRCMGQL